MNSVEFAQKVVFSLVNEFCGRVIDFTVLTDEHLIKRDPADEEDLIDETSCNGKARIELGDGVQKEIRWNVNALYNFLEEKLIYIKESRDTNQLFFDTVTIEAWKSQWAPRKLEGKGSLRYDGDFYTHLYVEGEGVQIEGTVPSLLACSLEPYWEDLCYVDDGSYRLKDPFLFGWKVVLGKDSDTSIIITNGVTRLIYPPLPAGVDARGRYFPLNPLMFGVRVPLVVQHYMFVETSLADIDEEDVEEDDLRVLMPEELQKIHSHDF